jgi:hypothetical protein
MVETPLIYKNHRLKPPLQPFFSVGVEALAGKNSPILKTPRLKPLLQPGFFSVGVEALAGPLE